MKNKNEKEYDWHIERNVVNGGQGIELPEYVRPKRVWTILDEDRLEETGSPRHHVNAFLEDRMHDWDVRGSKLFFYGHSGRPGELHDLLIEY